MKLHQCLVYLTIAPFFTAILSEKTGSELRVQQAESFTQVAQQVGDQANRRKGDIAQNSQKSGSSKKLKARQRHKSSKAKRAKRARVLRSEIEQLANPSPGSKTLGLQWVIDIRRNLSTLMTNLEQVEQQLALVKEQLKEKSGVAEKVQVVNVPTDAGQAQVYGSSIVCPWEMLNGGQFNKCYSFHNNDRRSWYQAAASCRVVGGRLLRISSAQETAFLLSRAPAWMSSGSAWLTTTWTDGNRLYPCPNDGGSVWPSETSWGWGTRMDRLCFNQLVDNEKNKNPIRVYTDWLMSADPQAGACVALAVASTNWEALDCDRPAAYVCERDPVRQSLSLMNVEESPSFGKITAEQGEEEDKVSSDAANKQEDAATDDQEPIDEYSSSEGESVKISPEGA